MLDPYQVPSQPYPYKTYEGQSRSLAAYPLKNRQMHEKLQNKVYWEEEELHYFSI